MNFSNSNNQTDINETRYLILNFQIEGNLRFLSHSQMLNVFQRAVTRGGINPWYSQGFNPRPKISLPLPRPVGVESDDEVLVMPVSIAPKSSYDSAGNSNDNPDHWYANHCLHNLSVQLPKGCKLLKANIVREKPSFQSCYANYIFTIRQEELNENMQKRINSLSVNQSLVIKRSINTRDTSKKIDVRGFLFSIITEQNSIIVRCKVSSAGSIRVQEIMELLELDTEKLVCPIKRTNVRWVG